MDKIRVLMVDDQAIFANAVEKMLQNEKDIEFHYCGKPLQALDVVRQWQPHVILQDLIMPEKDGFSLLKDYRDDSKLRLIPKVVFSTLEESKTKERAFSLGASDYLVKLPDPIELIARIRNHVQSYRARLERDEAYIRLEKTKRELLVELEKAAEYVYSALPAEMDEPVKVRWKFVPSQHLGGDAFGYHWLDPDTLSFYVLDVCGHGIGAALLSVSVLNVLRSRSLPRADFYFPASVLSALNSFFPMEEHSNQFFTMWYGVYDRRNRSLLYASGGHPPALLSRGDEVMQLKAEGAIVGGIEGLRYSQDEVRLEKGDSLFVFSDGVFEIETPEGKMLEFSDFLRDFSSMSKNGELSVERILEHSMQQRGERLFEDDYSLMHLQF